MRLKIQDADNELLDEIIKGTDAIYDELGYTPGNHKRWHAIAENIASVEGYDYCADTIDDRCLVHTLD